MGGNNCGWAMEAVSIMRERFLVSMMTAVLELHCPLNFSAPTKRDDCSPRLNGAGSESRDPEGRCHSRRFSASSMTR